LKPIDVTEQMLRDWPLPTPVQGGDKEDRGRVLLIGGSPEMPGAIILAALAALRAGAGKLCVATAASVAQLVAQALPEARVIGLAETDQGGLDPTQIERLPCRLDAVLLGPGMQDEAAVVAFTAAALRHIPEAQVVLDAFAMSVVSAHSPESQRSAPLLLTPHAGEMAHLSGRTKESIQADPQSAAIDASIRWHSVVAMKGATTFIAAPDGRLWRHTGGNAGLAISGSGDVLAGIIVGLAARGASTEQATVWGVALHARAGDVLERRFGPVGYLAREISREVPSLMRALA
jgi:ADP-dependent NAD(P)H-hydrate dehydratase